jgi:hypothetical protein
MKKNVEKILECLDNIYSDIEVLTGASRDEIHGSILQIHDNLREMGYSELVENSKVIQGFLDTWITKEGDL